MRTSFALKVFAFATIATAQISTAHAQGWTEWLGGRSSSNDAARRSREIVAAQAPNSFDQMKAETQAALNAAQAVLRGSEQDVDLLVFDNILKGTGTQFSMRFMTTPGNGGRIEAYTKVLGMLSAYAQAKSELVEAHNDVMVDFALLRSLQPRQFAQFDFSSDRPLPSTFTQGLGQSIDRQVSARSLLFNRGKLGSKAEQLSAVIHDVKTMIDSFEASNGKIPRTCN